MSIFNYRLVVCFLVARAEKVKTDTKKQKPLLDKDRKNL